MGDLRQIKKWAGALLEGLGHDPDEVAASLQAAGVQGEPRSNTSCAVALYTAALMRTDPRIRSVAVGPCSMVLTLTRPEDARSGGRLAVQLPKPVRDFVAGFDALEYPMVVRGLASETDVATPAPTGWPVPSAASTTTTTRPGSSPEGHEDAGDVGPVARPVTTV